MELDDPSGMLSADEAKAAIAALPDRILACYVLWDRSLAIPIYVGTARYRSRLAAHLKKDDLRDGKIGHTHVNPDFYAHVVMQKPGWLGLTYRLYDNEAESRESERALIAKHRLRSIGGSLFNRRMAG